MAGTFYWGWVGDHHGITKTMLLISVTDAIAKLLLFAVSGKIGFAFYFLLIGLFDKGMITVVGPGLVELFGIQGGTEHSRLYQLCKSLPEIRGLLLNSLGFWQFSILLPSSHVQFYGKSTLSTDILCILHILFVTYIHVLSLAND
jgi:hypothetical protein